MESNILTRRAAWDAVAPGMGGLGQFHVGEPRAA